MLTPPQIAVTILAVLAIAFLISMVTEARSQKQRTVGCLLFGAGLIVVLYLLHWTGVFSS